jgi:3-oxoacyl-[acyl-carrier-protein] synthase-3
MRAASSEGWPARVKVAGTGAYLPGEPIDNDRLAEFFGRDIVRLGDMLGARTRHLALDLATGKLREGESNANMAWRASLQALESAGLPPRAVDLLILSTSTPDYPFPGTALFLQDLLGLEECQVLELRAGCGGMAQAFAIAEQFIKSGRSQAALLVGSELISPFRRLLTNGPNTEKGDLVATAIFGDGAGAAVLVPSEDASGILGCINRSLGGGRAPGMILKVGGAMSPAGSNGHGDGAAFSHDFRAILQGGPELMGRALEWVWSSGLVAADDVTYYVPPQVSGHLITTIGTTQNLPPDKVFSNFACVGNTASASIYIALDTLNREGRLRPGDAVILLPAEAIKWTYGAIILNW